MIKAYPANIIIHKPTAALHAKTKHRLYKPYYKLVSKINCKGLERIVCIVVSTFVITDQLERGPVPHTQQCDVEAL